jgi:hypothetical protein
MANDRRLKEGTRIEERPTDVTFMDDWRKLKERRARRGVERMIIL